MLQHCLLLLLLLLLLVLPLLRLAVGCCSLFVFLPAVFEEVLNYIVAELVLG